jgi:hypothetical protein
LVLSLYISLVEAYGIEAFVRSDYLSGDELQSGGINRGNKGITFNGITGKYLFFMFWEAIASGGYLTGKVIVFPVKAR